jgi:tetraacyldisaccharide 4'-kinase
VWLERWLTRSWYEGGRAGVVLLPLSALYGLITALRRRLYGAGLLPSGRPACRVVVVGNLTAGGAGKTPLVIYLARRLAAGGVSVGVVSRGYGGGATATPVRVDADSDPGRVGDEPVLIARRTGVPVVVCRDRHAAAATLAEEGVELILCDDGLQHYALERDVELAVIDGRRGLGNGRLLPAGPLRESVARLRTVDLVVRNGGRPGPGEVLMTLAGCTVVNLHDGRRRPLADLAGERWHAVAGIADPERFFAALEAAGIELVRHPLTDHAPLSPAGLDFGDGRPLLMTEKDAVKCLRFASDRYWYLPVDASFAEADAERLLATVLDKTVSPAGNTHG